MSDIGRLYLQVPYTEKDQARAVGARWDPDRRQWWVDSQRVQRNEVARWLPSEPPASVDSGAKPTSVVHVHLLGLPGSCWRCKKSTTALVGILPVISRDAGDMLACKDPRALKLAAAVLPEPLRQSHQIGTIKSRSSKTEGKSYLSNGCFHCNALIGSFFLYYRELRGAIEQHGLAGLTKIAQATVAFQEVRPLLVRSNSWLGAARESEPEAHRIATDILTHRPSTWDFNLDVWRPRNGPGRPA
jgi:hypothetical protein